MIKNNKSILILLGVFSLLGGCKKHHESKNTITYNNLPSAINMPLPMSKVSSHNISLAWVAVMKKDYEDGKPTPINQSNSRCQTHGRPQGNNIWLPEICYMIPIDMRDDHNHLVAKDILLMGNDNIVAIEPKYRDGNKIISNIKISHDDMNFNNIPYAGIDEKTFNILYQMTKETQQIVLKTPTK